MFSNYRNERSRDFALPWHLLWNGFTLNSRPKDFDNLFSKVLTRSIQLRWSYIKILKNLIEDDHSVS